METTRTDAELAAAWQRGDTGALAAVFDRHAGAIHGFALARTRSAADAADVVQDTFVRATTRIHQLREPDRLRAWLFAIARRRVVDLGARRDVVTAEVTFASLPAEAAAPEAALVRDEVRELVWSAAASLTDRDRELLQLHLQHGLDGADLAAVVGVTPSHVYTLVNRVKERMSKAVGALLLARHGRRDCSELAGLLAGWDGRFTIDVRSRVTRHVESCTTCERQRATLAAPASFTAGALAVPALLPAGLRERVLGAAGGATPPPGVHAPGAADRAHRTLARRGWRRDGFPRVPLRARHHLRPAALPLSVAAGVLVLVAVGSVAVLRAAGDDAPRSAATATSLAGPAAPTPQPPGATGDDGTTSTAAAAPTTAIDGAAPAPGGPTEPRDGAPPPPTLATGAVPGGAGGPSDRDVALPPAVPADGAPADPGAPGASPSTTGRPSGGTGSDGSTTGTSGGGTTGGGTSAPSTTVGGSTPTTAPPPPASLTLSTTSLALGSSGTGGTVTVTNQGGQPATLSTSTSSSALTVSNGSATVAPGSSVALGVTLDRALAAEGGQTFTVSVGAPGASGGGQVVVTATVEHAPVITSVVRTPSTIRTSTSCGQTLARVTVEVSDESAIASVSVLWSSDGVFAQRTSLALDANGRWTGQVGSFSATGTRTLTVDVSDARGNDASASTTVTVVAC